MNAKDLEFVGWTLADAGRQDLLRSVGHVIWDRWSRGIANGKHPRRSDLLAFLRAWADPAGDWLPERMAEYLADRLDPEVPTPDRGGRPRLSHSKEFKKYARDMQIASKVLDAWRAHRKDGTPYPQQAAYEGVAERSGIPVVEVRLAFSRYRKAVEVLAKLAESDSSMESLSNAELEVLWAGPEDLWSLVLKALPPEELNRVGRGESLYSVLGLFD